MESKQGYLYSQETSKSIALWTHITESTQCRIQLWFKFFGISELIGQNLTSKSKWWILFIACKWEPSVEFDSNVCVDSRQCLTDTSKLNLTLGTFSDICLWSSIAPQPLLNKIMHWNGDTKFSPPPFHFSSFNIFPIHSVIVGNPKAGIATEAWKVCLNFF